MGALLSDLAVEHVGSIGREASKGSQGFEEIQVERSADMPCVEGSARTQIQNHRVLGNPLQLYPFIQRVHSRGTDVYFMGFMQERIHPRPIELRFLGFDSPAFR